MSPGSPAIGVYVDTVNVVGVGATEVNAIMDSVADRFEQLGIPFVVTDRAGCAVRNTRLRAWRLWLATRGMAKRQRLSGELVRVWLGHVNFYFAIARPCLSVLSSCYRFASQNLGRRAVVWPNVRKELREVMGLIFMVEHDLLSERSPLVHLGDSSMFGFSLMSTVATDAEIKRELEVKEKWGFIQGRSVDVKPSEGGPLHQDFVGHQAVTTAATRTKYAQSLVHKLEETGAARLRQQQCQLFGPPKSVEPTLMEAIRHPPVSSGWHTPAVETISLAETAEAPRSFTERLKERSGVQLTTFTARVAWRDNRWAIEDRTKAAGSYSAALTQQWASLLEGLCPTTAKCSSLDSLAEVDGQLKLAAERSQSSSAPELFLGGTQKRKPLVSVAKVQPVAKGKKRKQVPKVDLQGRALAPSLRLKAAKVTQKTLDAYHLQIEAFESWAASRRLKVTKANLDPRVVSCMTWVQEHDDGEPWNAAYLIYGLQLLRCNVPKPDFLPNSKQGMGLVRIEERENPGRYGEWFAGTLVAVSGGHLQWWLDTGEGSSEQRWFSVHVCAKSPATCRGSKGHPDMEFHFQSLRSIPLSELGPATSTSLEDPITEERGAPQDSTPAAAETQSLGQEEEWDDELLEALGVSEDEDTLRDSLEHAAKYAVTGWWNLTHLQAAVRRLLGTKPTWEQVLEWFMREGRRFPTPLGSFFRRMEETEAAPPGAEPTKEPDLLPIHVDATCNIEVVENCSQVVLEYPARPQLPLLLRVDQPCVLATAGRGPAVAEKILSSRSRDYEGNMVERVGEIQADLVIGAWPKVGEAAVASVVDFLSGDALKAVISPRPHFKRGSDQPRTSKRGKVHASQEEWNKVVAAAFQRNMMGPVDESAVPRDSQGHLITNGAGAVEKRKLVGGKEVAMQRFISNFVPINEFLEALPGDQDFLPYVAQLGLLLLDDSQTLMIESEDLTSAFNLFRMPDTWLPFFSYAKKVPGHIMGSSEEWVRPGLRVIPMGWSSAVTIMQADIPAEGGAVLYLDSFDQVRMVDTTLRAVEEGGIQGGVLDGDKGAISVGSDKAEKLVLATLGLLASASWSEAALRRWVGIATFVAAFRRPLFAVFQEIFPLIERAKEGAVDPDRPLCSCSPWPPHLCGLECLVRSPAPMRHCGAGEPLWPRPPGGPQLRLWKRTRLESVPAAAEKSFCSIWCIEEHREHRCSRRNYLCPTFAEFFPEPGQPLTEAMALNKVAVLTAFGPNINDKDDFWGQAGKEKLERMEADPLVAAKFWSPPFNTFGLGRGEQVRLQNGRWVDAPPALRAGGHLTGLAGLSNTAAFEVRRANTLALRALKSLSRAVEENFLCYVCQAWDSYLWYFPEAEELRETKGSSPRRFLCAALVGPNDHEEEPKAWYDSTGRIQFACCEELRLPGNLCDTLALAIKKDLAEICPLIPGKLTDRTMDWQLMAQLRGASSSLRSPAAAEAAAEVIAPIAREILEDPIEHLRRMLSRGHYRGTEVRLMAPNEPDNLKMVPYPAHLWRWRNTLSFAWHNEDNITTLEMLAALAEIRRRARQLNTQGTRFFHILDSQVVYHVMAKGASALDHFGMELCRYCVQEELQLPNTVKDLDFALGEFMNESFQEGDSPGYAGEQPSQLVKND
ncbi:unnamed protein product [Symbiodinium sp. CCMP2592]|nr:unnamed protein product [Symbiodinium sp. CCMP2592]